MNFIIKHFIGIITVTIVFVSCLLLFLFALASKSIQQQKIEVSHTGILESNASIQEDRYGIPYIYASTSSDALFLLGVTHAKDRLFQMDFLRRAGRGQLSEVLGSSYVESDKFARTLQLQSIATSQARMANDTIRAMVSSYSRGVNYFINTNKNSLSIEFDNLGYVPEQWTIEDSYLLWKLHSLESDVSFWASLTAAELQYSLGEEHAKDLLAFTIKDKGTVIDTTSKKQNSISFIISITSDTNVFLPYVPPFTLQKKLESTTKEKSASKNQSFDEFSKQSKEFKAVLGWNQSKSACASWVFSTNKDTSKSIIVVADIHATLQLPAKWYICSIVTRENLVSGATLPGIPFVINGRNQSQSWSFTSYSADQTDLFVEVLNDNATECSKNNGESVPIIYQVDTVIQKNDEPIFFRRRSVNGMPIISDWFPKESSWLQKSTKPKKNIHIDYVLSLKSLLYDSIVDPFSILHAVALSPTSSLAKRAVSNWRYPTQLLQTADKQFGTYLQPIGAIPQRNPECVFTFTNPGWNDQRFGWTNTYEYLQDQEPKQSVQQKQYSIGTNTEFQFMNGKQYHGWYEQYFRNKRITSLLGKYQEYSVREAQFMLNDVTSLYAIELLQEVKGLYPSIEKTLSNEEQSFVKLLFDWEGIYSKNDSLSLVYSLFHQTLLKELYFDDLGEYYFAEYGTLPSMRSTKTLLILRDTLESKWTGTVAKERFDTKKNMLVNVFKKTLKEYKKVKQQNSTNRLQVKFTHLTESIPSIRTISSLGPFEYKGDEFTIQSFEQSLLKTKSKGSSFRFITNLLENYYYCVVAGGNSGEPLDVHYSDQIQLWLNGGYCKVYVTNQPLQNLTTIYSFY